MKTVTANIMKRSDYTVNGCACDTSLTL